MLRGRRLLGSVNWRYAMGELLIVVFGILIAIQADRWNASRLERAALSGYYGRIVQDLEADEAMLDRYAESARAHSVAADRLLDLFERSDEPPPDSILRSAMTNVRSGIPSVGVRSTTFRDMLATGSLVLIREEPLRNALIDYYEESTGPELKEALDFLAEHNTDPIDELLARHVDDRLLFGSLVRDSTRPFIVTSWSALSGDAELATQLRQVSAGQYSVAGYFQFVAGETRALRSQVTEAR